MRAVFAKAASLAEFAKVGGDPKILLSLFWGPPKQVYIS